MKQLHIRIIISMVTALVIFIGVGMYQNYMNTPTRGCAKYDASDSYWGYTCKNDKVFYIQK